MSPSFTVLICFLFLSPASSVVYTKVGGKVVLDPGPLDKLIETMTWKHGEDIAVEWYGKGVISYRHFNGCTALNMSTGALTISPLNLDHSGSYTAEINSVAAKSMEIRVLFPVPKPEVSMRCDAEHDVCTLTCTANTTGAEPARYSWSIFDVSNYERGPVFILTKENPDPWFRCDLENDVSTESSEKIYNPFKGRSHLFICISLACVVVFLIVLLIWVIRKNRKGQYAVGTVEESEAMLGASSNGGAVTFSSVQETTEQNHMSSVVPVVGNNTETVAVDESSDRDKTSKESSDEPEIPAERQEDAPVQVHRPAEGPDSSDHTEIPAERQEEVPVQVHRPAEGPESSDHTATTEVQQTESSSEAGASAVEPQASSDHLKAASATVSCDETEKSADESAGEETNGSVSTSVGAP